MKKLFVTVSVIFLLLFGIATISASADRYTELPITMNQNRGGIPSMFTMTDFEVYVYLNETPKYTKNASIYIEGEFNQGSSVNLAFYCYDASGNHIKTFTDTLAYDDVLWYYFEFDIPDVTATIEVGTAYPASWTNTYYYCKYMNVYSADGRVLGIHDILLPVYEKCGWHGPVTMWSLEGDAIEVPYNDVKAYQNVGWYLWEDYYYIDFTKSYNDLTRKGDYSAAFDAVDYALSELSGTYYESSLYSYKTKLMDAWREKINGPLAYCSHSVDKSNGNVSITFRNVSYKYITAFKIQFQCYDTFSNSIKDYNSYYYCDDAELYSGESMTYYWEGTPYNTDYIKNIRVTQVVYSDGTSWYR